MPQTKEQIAVQRKEYREKNKEQRAAYEKEYREKNKEQLAAYEKEYREKNKEQLAALAQEYYKKNKEQRAAYEKEYRLKSKYGMSLKEKNVLLQKQNNKCKICLVEFSNITPNIDHCHTTNKVRGLLCLNCNTGLGHFKDNTKLLTQAINYLQENK
tara:strand:- start:65 stop:532 length:468 start_codon:yes stop_codon:yes gene_type:complete